MKNAMDPDVFFFMLKIYRVREAAYKNPPEEIYTCRIMFGMLGDLRVGSCETPKEFLAQPGILFLIPPIAIVGVLYRLGD
jgi:hypothetical protein